jgi:hypothetical protein
MRGKSGGPHDATARHHNYWIYCYHIAIQNQGVVMRYLIALCLFCTSANAEAVFPTAVSSKYSNEKPDKARQRTCLDQYMTNKATNGNDGLVWQHKGGGYYSECKKRLK